MRRLGTDGNTCADRQLGTAKRVAAVRTARLGWVVSDENKREAGRPRDPAQVEVGRRLQAARRAVGMSQPEACAQLGVDQTVLSRWENGVWFPRAVFLRKLADLYGVSVDSLLGRETSGDDQDWPEGAQFLRRAGKELTPEAKAAMIRAMEAFMDMNRQRRSEPEKPEP